MEFTPGGRGRNEDCILYGWRMVIVAANNQIKQQARGTLLRSEGGWSLMEVMVVTGMIVILAGIAAPQYSQIARQMRASAAASQLLGNLAYALAQSIRTGVRHYVSTSGETGVSYRVQRVGTSNVITPEEDSVLRAIDLRGSMPGVEFDLNGADTGPYGNAVAGAAPTTPIVFTARGMPIETGAYYVRTSEGSVAYAVSVTGAGRARLWRQTEGGWQ
jgi:Tfp pilus assembly protein FimT